MLVIFDEVFNALRKEASFTKEMLGSGVTQIRNANYSQQGLYFQAFTSLSTGLERIGKLCLMLDYYIDHNGEFPDINFLKKDIGHKILLLYKKSLAVIDKRSFSFEFKDNLDEDIHQNILKVLSEFAEGDRYSNLNLLVNSKQEGDPIALWFKTVDQVLFENCVSDKKKANIARNSNINNQLASERIRILSVSETGSEITSVQEASYRTGMLKAVAPYRQLYVLQIIRFWVELVVNLQYEAMSLGKENIPFLIEIFGSFYNTDSYFKGRKKWDNI
ncbi:MAG: hypothetical protein KDJ65_22245 [Anaerolineae bacterium]|nr:hypothetical protein [Anaerolineae bacterium]